MSEQDTNNTEKQQLDDSSEANQPDEQAQSSENGAADKGPDKKSVSAAGSDSENKEKKEEVKEEDVELKVNRAAVVLITRAAGDMRATIQVTPPVGAGTPVNEDLIRKALNERKVTFGIDEEKLQQIIDEQIYVQTLTIAEGEPPENGSDAQLIYHFDKLVERQDYSLDNLGQVDWKELGNIINTTPDVLLLEKIPPTEGKPGTTVTGKRVRQTKGRDLRIRAGKGVRVDESGLKWFSEIAGHVIFRNDQISVENIIEFEDVNTSTGNVHFNGTVIVKGIVEDGFTVDSTADIRIQGNVGASKLMAKGDIAIVGGVFGKKQALIQTDEGTIYSRFTQDAKLLSGADIVIDEYARNSELKARSAIRILNENPDRGCIIGGSASALEEVNVNNVGNEMELHTRVAVGISKEEIERTSTLEANVKKSLENLDNLRKSMFILHREKVRNRGQLDRRKKELYERFLAMLDRLRVNNLSDINELLRLYLNAYGQKKSYLHVNKVIYPNVEVNVKNATMDVKKQIDFATLTENEGEVVILPYMGRDDGNTKSK